MVGVLGFPAVLDHRRSKTRIDEFLYPEDFGTAAMRLSEQRLHGGKVPVGLRDVDDVIQIVVGVNVALMQLQGAIMFRLQVGINLVGSAEARVHLGPEMASFLELFGLERLWLNIGIDDQSRKLVRRNIEVSRLCLAVDSLGRVAGTADVLQRSTIRSTNQNPGLKLAGSFEENRLILWSHLILRRSIVHPCLSVEGVLNFLWDN